ncbi:MAG TPA: gluconate 2-dehydrogenase subunit 3 family protein [Blastocatellia bacterium]|nr:gluconate 2-dehydrogenase subunit 3 family protein [Blastocatellia bacterium]
MATEKDEITRREAIKTIGVGAGVIAVLPVLSASAVAQEATHDHAHRALQASTSTPQPQPLRFFTDEENRTVVEMSERIIPADDSSPGAKEAKVNEYIDLIVSVSPEPTQQTWRDGLAAVNKMSRDRFGKTFVDASADQQIELLTEISKNEKAPQTVEEKFFRTIKYATVDGYYTSEIGIKKELRYKGNSYLKEFTGCTHPEHQQ